MPKIIDHAAYRADLLDGAQALFAGRGYAGLSMRAIASGLGVSTGTLYHYFQSKQDLFLQVVEHVTDQFAEVLTAATRGPGTPRERLRALLVHVAENEEWYARYNRLCLDYLRTRDSGGAEVMAAATARAERVLAEMLLIDEAGARFLLVALFGIVTQRDLDGGATSLTAQAALLQEWFDAHSSVDRDG